MNALQIAKIVRQECGIAGADAPASFVDQTGEMKRLVDWIIQADLYIQSLTQDWKFLWKEFTVPTVIGQAGYTIPSDFDEWDKNSFVLDAATDDFIRLDYIEYTRWRNESSYGLKVNDPPYQFTIKPDGSIVLDAPPDKIYQLTADYYRKPVALAANADEPPYPERYQRVLVARAKRMYATYEDAPEVLTEAEDEYREIMMRMESSQIAGQENRYGESNNSQMVVEVV